MSNGVEKDAPAAILEHEKPTSIGLSELLEQHKEMLQGLNSLKARREATAQLLKDLETSEHRTEGAVITLEGQIRSIDPSALQPQAAGR
jgi:hypothetical protein